MKSDFKKLMDVSFELLRWGLSFHESTTKILKTTNGIRASREGLAPKK